MRIFLFSDWRLERDWFLRNLQHLAHFSDWNVHALGNFFRCRLASQFLHQLSRGANQLVDGFDHVHRNADGAGLVGNSTRNGLSNPPGGVRRELITTAIFELIYRFHQADVAFLDQVQKLQTAVGVLFGDRDHQSQVSFDQLPLGVLRVHVALDDLALSALEFLKRDASLGLHFLQFRAELAGLAAVFLALLLAARGIGLLFEALSVAIERAHAIYGAIYTLDQPLAFGVGESQIAHCQRDQHHAAG